LVVHGRLLATELLIAALFWPSYLTPSAIMAELAAAADGTAESSPPGPWKQFHNSAIPQFGNSAIPPGSLAEAPRYQAMNPPRRATERHGSSVNSPDSQPP